MSDDPGGLYSRLDVDPTASPEVIAAAYRRKARVLHPDVPRTGDAQAFIRVKEAYDVLSDAERRARYDRAAHAAPEPPARWTMAEPVVRPRLSDLPVALWVVLGGVFCLAAFMAVRQLSRPPPQPSHADVRPFAPSVPAMRPTSPPLVASPASGSANHYVLPAGEDAILWQYDPARDVYLPAGRVAAFTPVMALRLVAGHGLVELRMADGGSAFIDATRLTAGDATAARRANCAYNAGPSPRNGDVLTRMGEGTARIEISNRATQPAVVKLRDASGRSAATVFVAAGDHTIVGGLPDMPYRPEFAVGELWSRLCNDFAAGTRAQRFAGFASPAGLSPLVIPPELSVGPAPVDIPDTAFERE